MATTVARKLPTADKAPNRVPMMVACRKLGISRMSFMRHWLKVFTAYETPGGNHLVSEDELLEALRYTRPADAQRAVRLMRVEKGRM